MSGIGSGVVAPIAETAVAIDRDQRRLGGWLIAAALLLHLPLIFLPAVSLEFTFAGAADYFKSGDPALLQQFFDYQANSLGMPLLGRLAEYVLPTQNMLVILRLISACSIVLLGFGTLRMAKFLGRKDLVWILLLLLANPLVWTYSARATADFFPAALAFYAVSILVSSEASRRQTIAAVLLFSLSVLLKYHALALGLFVMAAAMSSRPDRRVLHAGIWAGLTASTALALYGAVISARYGFWLTPPKFQSFHGWRATGLLNNMALYCGYLVLLCLPFSLLLPRAGVLFRRHSVAAMTLATGLFAVGYFLLGDTGELNFGPLDGRVSPAIVNGIFLVIGCGVAAPILLQPVGESTFARRRKFFGLALIGVLVALSLSRPAQRYLLFVIPFFLLALPPVSTRIRPLAGLVLFCFMLVNAFIGYSQWCKGNAALEMVQQLESSGRVTLTAPGAIESEVGEHFYGNKNADLVYEIVAGEAENSLFTVRRGWSRLAKTFSLVPLRRTPTVP